MTLTKNTMTKGGRYNWKGQPERLVYIGHNWSGNGYWHQFEKVGEPGEVWCEVFDNDLHMLEETVLTPQAEQTAQHIGACISSGKLYATVMQQEADGSVTVVSVAEMDAASLVDHDRIAELMPVSELYAGLSKVGHKFAGQNGLSRDQPEDDFFSLEAAMQHGFEMIDDDGDVFVCNAIQIANLLRPIKQAARKHESGQCVPVDVYNEAMSSLGAAVDERDAVLKKAASTWCNYDILSITTAYEQGFGHAWREELSNPYQAGTKEYVAWDMGCGAGKKQTPKPGEPCTT